MELIQCSRLVRKALQHVHQGKLRLPTGRSAGLLTQDRSTDWGLPNETCVAVRIALSECRSARLPHGGGLDAYGCHNNRKAGGYHCHRGPLAGQSFQSKEEMLRQLGTQNSPTTPNAKEKR